MRPEFLDLTILSDITRINITHTLLLFGAAFVVFYLLPRWLFPQRYAGAGMEQTISNILYMLAYIELFIPLFVFLKVFNIPFFIAFIILTKLFFIKFFYKEPILPTLKTLKHRLLIDLFDFFDDPRGRLREWRKRIRRRFYLYLKNLNYFLLFKDLLIASVFLYLVFVMGYRCFISTANPLPDTSQFFEWVANLNNNILWADNKTAGADFYGISVFIFFLHIITNIDTIVLFNIYPLLLITFLLFGVYFVLKRFSLSALVALAVLLVYGGFLVSSPLNQQIATMITTTNDPEIVHFLGLKFYNIPEHYFERPDLYLESVNMTSYIRYFSGMAYEFSSSMFLINLFYLIKSIDSGRARYLINYTLSLMLVFIFHGGGAIILIVPSILIAINALLSLKLNLYILKKGLLAITIAAIFGNGWMLSVLKYGIPQDFGAAAPFLDRLFGTKQAMAEIATAGIEEVIISHLTQIHLFLALSALLFFLVARLYKKGFYFSSFLLIPLGVMFVYFSQNLGFAKLVHPARGAEYLYLALAVLLVCYIKPIYLLLKLLFAQKGKYLFLLLVYAEFFSMAIFVPKFYETEVFKKFINGVQYSEIPLFLYKIIEQNRPLTWTVVSYVQEYSKVLGKGYMINVNEFITKYDPRAKYLEVPTPKVYIFVEDIPHRYNGKEEWYYRWRRDIEQNLKEWVTLYSQTHDNIKIFGKTRLLTVYEIDNSEYIHYLEKNHAK